MDHRDDRFVLVIAAGDHQKLADRASVDDTGSPLADVQHKQSVIRSVGDSDDIVVLAVDTVSTNDDDDHRDAAVAVVVGGDAMDSAVTAKEYHIVVADIVDIAVLRDNDPHAGMFRALAEYLYGTDRVGDNDGDHDDDRYETTRRAKNLHVWGLLHFFVVAVRVRIAFHYFGDYSVVVDRLDGYNSWRIQSKSHSSIWLVPYR